MKYVHYFSLIIAALLLLSACQSEAETTTDSKELKLNASALESLIIDHRNGDIEVIGDARSETIQVSAEISHSGNIDPDKLQLGLEKSDGQARLKAFFKGQFLASGKGTVNLKITLPADLSVQILSHQDGSIHISDLASAVSIDNVNGKIDIKNIGKDVNIHNRDGNIDVQNAAADLYVTNVNGAITAERIGGSAIIDVGDGKLDIDQVDGDVTVKQSGSGEVQVGQVKGSVNQKR